jgi:glycosyltransferase involved in cell wall biosynthesis
MKIGFNGYSFGSTKDRVSQYITFSIRALLEKYPEHEFFIFVVREPKIVLPKNSRFICLGKQGDESRKKWEKRVQKHETFAKLDFFHSFEQSSIASKKIPCGVTFHSSLPLKPKNSLWQTFFQRGRVARQVKNAALIVTVTDVLRKEISRAFSLPLNHIRVIPGAVDTYFQKTPELETIKKVQKNITKGFDFLLYVGKVRKTSNIRNILGAFGRIIQDPRFAKLKLVITGRVPYHKDSLFVSESEIHKMIQESGTKGNVLLPGPIQREELRALYKSSKGVICDTTDLGFPVVAFEAALASAPMLFPISQAYIEFFSGEYLTYDPTNPKSLRLGMSILADSAISKNDQTVKAEMTAHSYSWQETAYSVIQAIIEVVEKNPRNR